MPKTRPLPKLERLLADADITPEVVQYLSTLGFRVSCASKIKSVNISDDCAVVRYARRHNRILICHDRHNGEIRFRFCQEIHRWGGHVIEIEGGPEQECFTCLGKFLVHREHWLPFIAANDGICIIRNAGKITFRRRNELLQHIQYEFTPDVVPEVGQKSIPIKKRRSRKKTIQISPDQQPLL